MLDSIVSSFVGLVVDETVTLARTIFHGDLAGQYVAESRESIMKSLVINGSIQVLDEDVTRASLAKSRITLGPHDTAGLTLDQSVVEGFQSTLT
jgi:hypothetical protein